MNNNNNDTNTIPTEPIVDELLQHFTPTRIPDILDGIADIFGGLTGAYIRKYI